MQKGDLGVFNFRFKFLDNVNENLQTSTSWRELVFSFEVALRTTTFELK